MHAYWYLAVEGHCIVTKHADFVAVDEQYKLLQCQHMIIDR